MKEVQAKLRKKEPGKTKSLIKLEKKLENWFAQRSLAQILDWFDCIENNIDTDYHGQLSMVRRIRGQRQAVLDVLGSGYQVVYALSDFQDYTGP
jgi:hypothetical protein